ncbi:MAG: hypothetical protein ACM3O7_01460 [Acidobacteriota bacterium]
MARRAVAIGSVALVLLVGPAGQRLARAGESEADKAGEARFCQALDRTIEGKLPLDQVRLGVSDRQERGWRSMTVYGDGVGIWKGARQFEVKPRVVKKMLKMLERAKFCTMESGGSEEEGDALRVMRGISLALGDLTKSVNQMERQGNSRQLDALVTRLLDTCAKAGEGGVAVSSLQDALSKLLDGTLAPQVLSVSLNAPERGSPESGWLVQIHGRDVTAVSHQQGAGYGERRRGRLSEAEFAALARDLASNGVAAIPLNVYAPEYTDLSLSVLDQRRTIQARAFAGMTPDTNRPAQEAFQKLREALHAIYLRVGTPGATSE